MPNSICPKGWQLPSSAGDKSYQKLIRDVYNIYDAATDANLLANSAISFVRLGIYFCDYGSLYNRGYSGDYWSSTAYSSILSFYLDFYSGLLNPQNGAHRAHGFSIRCVSR